MKCDDCPYKPWQTGIKIFENAILEFGVNAALEYFATPEELRSEFDDLKKQEKLYKRRIII